MHEISHETRFESQSNDGRGSKRETHETHTQRFEAHTQNEHKRASRDTQAGAYGAAHARRKRRRCEIGCECDIGRASRKELGSPKFHPTQKQPAIP